MTRKIAVLSYNLSFGAMLANEASIRNRSAFRLAQYCKEKRQEVGDHVCLNNVVKIIDMVNNSTPYDFVALQECPNWRLIHQHSKKLNDMGYIHHKISKYTELATFYNYKRYKVLAIKVDQLVKGRPYQIIFLQERSSYNYYIFINLHNMHYSSKQMLEKQLSNKLQYGIKNTNRKYLSDLHKYYPSNISDIINNKIFRVIIAGDFNDEGRNYWTGLRPFKYTQFPNLQKIVVKTDKKPPKTCCIGEKHLRERKNEDHSESDYILHNKLLTVIKPNYVPLKKTQYKAEYFPTSDHLPIMAIFL